MMTWCGNLTKADSKAWPRSQNVTFRDLMRANNLIFTELFNVTSYTIRVGLHCEGASFCACRHGLRIPRQTDRRAFQRIPRDSHVWQRLYNKRTSVERVNSRLDVSFGFENHTIRGMKKMQLRCSLALLVMNTLAYTHLLCNADSTTYRSLTRLPAWSYEYW